MKAPFGFEIQKTRFGNEIITRTYKLKLLWLITLGLMFDTIETGGVTLIIRVFPLSMVVSFGLNYEL